MDLAESSASRGRGAVDPVQSSLAPVSMAGFEKHGWFLIEISPAAESERGSPDQVVTGALGAAEVCEDDFLRGNGILPHATTTWGLVSRRPATPGIFLSSLQLPHISQFAAFFCFQG
jgi:hypothetical protein